MERYSKGQNNQGIVLKAEPIPYIRMSEVNHLQAEKRQGLLWVFLDEINDPQNLGAIMRSCFYFGVSGVFVGIDKRCPLTPAVSKASAGAMELMDMFCVDDPAEFLSSIF